MKTRLKCYLLIELPNFDPNKDSPLGLIYRTPNDQQTQQTRTKETLTHRQVLPSAKTNLREPRDKSSSEAFCKWINSYNLAGACTQTRSICSIAIAFRAVKRNSHPALRHDTRLPCHQWITGYYNFTAV